MRWSGVRTVSLVTVVALGWSCAAASEAGTTAADDRRSTSTTKSTTPTTTTTVAPARTFTLAATGDLLIHSPLAARALADGGGAGRNFGPMLSSVAPVLAAADMAVCHLETPLARPDQALRSYPVFRVPGELAAAIAETGWDTCSTASNHAIDGGADGVTATLEQLDTAGVSHVGTARDQVEADELALFEVNGVVVGHLSATYGFNGFSVPADTPWLAESLDVARILAEAASLRAAGAEFVVASLHWGVENVVAPTTEQSTLARQLLASPDVDLILGHHAHVVQPVERIGDEVVVYGLGNFLSNQSAACCPAATQDGVIVELTVTERRRQGGRFVVSDVAAVPTFVERGTYRVVPVVAALADPATPASARAELEASLTRTTAALATFPAEVAIR